VTVTVTVTVTVPGHAGTAEPSLVQRRPQNDSHPVLAHLALVG
jgi:hypothetical protein